MIGIAWACGIFFGLAVVFAEYMVDKEEERKYR